MSELKEVLATAQRAERAGDLQGAVRAWMSVVGVTGRPEVHVDAAEALSRLGFITEGEGVLRASVAQHPGEDYPLFALGSYLDDRGKSHEAIATLQQALHLRETVPTLVVLGVVYRKSGDIPSARDCYERALSLDPHEAEAWYNLGLTYRSENAHKAHDLFTRATREDESFAPAYRELGRSLWRRGDLHGAEASLLKAIELDPADAWAHDYLGSVLHLQGAASAALAEFERAIALSDGQPLFLCHAGDALMTLDSTDRAERMYVQALELDVNYYLANLKYAEALLARGLLGRARQYLLRALAVKPQDRRVLSALQRIDRSADSADERS